MSESSVSHPPYVLLVTQERGSTIEHPLVPGRSVVLGSSRHCGIQLSGQDVASMHCVIDLNDGVLGIQDWASPSGTIVNGKPIVAKTSIAENDQVKIGSAVIAIRRATARGAVAAQANDIAEQQDDDILEQQRDSVSVTLGTLDHEGPELRTTNDLNDEDCQMPGCQSEPAKANHAKLVDDTGDALLGADDYDWNADFDVADEHPLATTQWEHPADSFDQYDAETVQLLKAEIDDLRSMLADRDFQVAELSNAHQFGIGESSGPVADHEPQAAQRRVDELLAEAAENDERFQILQDLLQSAELKNQAEGQERHAFEAWVGEIEHRIGQRESEWKAEIEAVRQQLNVTEKERNQLQHQVREVASRFGAQDVYRETLDKLQSDNAALQEQLAKTRKQAAAYRQQLENIQNRESEAIQQERALIAKERASVSRMRFQLSRKLAEFEQTTEPKNPADREVALRLQTLRSHLREIHEQEQLERGQKGESLFTRISGLWKKMDEY